MSDRDILGQWCGDRDNPTWVNYRFTRDKLHVTTLPARKQKSFNIVRYDFSDPEKIFIAGNALLGELDDLVARGFLVSGPHETRTTT